MSRTHNKSLCDTHNKEHPYLQAGPDWLSFSALEKLD